MATDARDAGPGTLDPRQRLEVVLGAPRPDPHDDPRGRPPPPRAESPESSAWTSWIEETAAEGPAAEPVGSRPRLPERGLRRWLPAGVRGARIDPGRRGAAVLAVVALAAAALAGMLVWGGRPRAEPISALPVLSVESQPGGGPSPRAGPPSGAPSGGPSPAPAQLVVSVVGKVARPGLVTVAEGARVADVLTAAGGPVPGVDLSALNLARRVSDGEQVAVGVPAAPDALPAAAAAGGSTPGGSGGGAAGAPPAGPVDLNSAGVGQLDTLPGVGPVTAQRIVEWRTRNGRFTRIEQLREIDGIGERRFEQLRGLVRV